MAQDDMQISRRNLLMKLGLAATAAYVAPTLVGLDVARASTGSSGGSGSASGASGASGPSRSSGPSRNSRPSRASGPSRPQSNSGGQTQWRWNAQTNRFVRVTSAR
jgi:hypothetical protein